MRRPTALRSLLGLAPVLLLGACGLELENEGADADDGSATTTTVVLADQDEDAPPLVVGAPTIKEELDVGDCFNEYRWMQDGRRVEVITEVACTEPHTGEVYLTLQYPAPFGTPYPGDDAMARYARGACYQGFEAFVGVPYEVSAFEIGTVTPTQANFEDEAARYRGITCYVHQPGVALVGTAANSRG
jgi:hypothetical protein